MSQYKIAVLMIVLAGICLSTLGIGTRLLESTSGLEVVFYRSIGAAMAMWLYLFIKHGNNTLLHCCLIGKPGIYATLCLCGTSIFIVLALSYTTVANAMFTIALAPLTAGLLAWLIIGERVSKTTLIASLIALVGVFVIVRGAINTSGLLGIFFAALMLVCYSLYTVCLRVAKEVDMLPCIALHTLVLIVSLGLVLEDLSIPASDLLVCLGLGVFQLALGITLFSLGAKHVPAAQVTLLAMLEIVLSPIWVWLGIGETPSSAALLGGTIIVIAVSYQALVAPPPQELHSD